MPFVYGFKNDSMPDLIKIGHHGGDTPLTRLNEANLPNTWCPPTPYYFAFAIEVQESFKVETYIHNLLINERVNMNREFFRISLEDVKNIINSHMHIINGEWWIPPPLDLTAQYLTKNNKVFKNKCIKQLNELIICCETIYKELNKLQLLTDDGINCNKTFTRENLEILDYKTLSVSEIHSLCGKQIFKKKEIGTDGKINKYEPKKAKTILNHLLEYIGYAIHTPTPKQVKQQNGKYNRVYIYQVQPIKFKNKINRFIFNNKNK